MYEYKRRLGVFREKNSKLKYKSEGTIQTEYKEPQLPKKKKKRKKKNTEWRVVSCIRNGIRESNE